MKYEELSDFEINKRVATVLGIPWYIHFLDDDLVSVGDNTFDPCNDWGQAGPIIEGNDISIAKLNFENGPGWGAWTGSDHANHKNPLRAAMICFLVMKDGEK